MMMTMTMSIITFILMALRTMLFMGAGGNDSDDTDDTHSG